MTTGFLVRENATDITDPVPNETVVLQTTTVGGRTAGQLYLWNGAAWVALTGSGTGVPAGPITTSGLTQATNKLLGRTTAATGAIEEITVGSNLTLAAGTLSGTGGGSGGLVFIDEQTITGAAAQDLNFTGLDGNTDVMYKIIGVIKIGQNTTTLTFRVNGATTNLSYIRVFNAGNDTVANIIAAANTGAYVAFEAIVQAKANPDSQAFVRFIKIDASLTETTPALTFNISYSILFNDSSSNITSLGIHADTASGIGRGSYATIYKYAQS